jgi:TonB-linked SusC/RagA family outer membrane protein
MKKLLLLSSAMMLIAFTALAQKTVTGVVTDDSGLPLPGASVVEQGTSNGVSADFDGNFSIEVAEGAVLEFSYMGYQTSEQTVGSSDSINASLVADNELDEVIVSGVAGATSRKKLSVTVASVKAEDIEAVPASSASGALMGKVAGVTVTNLGQPGQGATIVLRGATNFYGSQEPLVILDGVFVEGGLGDINVDDIASFEIVKGASASSLYGSRAGNGVIVITSKRGKIGKTQVTFRTETGYNEITNFITTNQSHAWELAPDFAQHQGQYTALAGVTYPVGFQSVYAASGPQATSGAKVLKADQYSDNPFGVYNDFQSLFFKKGMNTTNYVSVSGGDEKISTLFSFENYSNEGVLNETEGYKRTSIRANIDYNLSDNLKFSASNAFIKVDDLAPGVGAQGYRNITRLSPDSNLTYDNPDGQKYWFTPDPHESEIQNPLYGLATPTLGAKQSRFLGGYNLRYNISSVFTVELEYSFESDNYRYSSSNPYNYYQINSEEPGFGYSKGSLYQNNYYQLAQKAQATLNYRQEFGAFDIKAKLSWLGEDLSYEQFSASGIDYLYAGLPTLDNFKGESITATGDKQVVRASNMFLIAGVTYKEKYILDALVRRDGSSQFGADERYNNYSRVSAAWRITEDITIPGIQEMKINAAYGTSGQRPGFNWQYEQVSLSNGQLSSNRLKGNSNLKPSQSAETEIGLNVSFLDRFTFEAAHATTETSDQFMLVGLFSPANAGKNRQWQNVGDLEATTIEASLKANVLNTQNMRWDIGVNYATTTNEIKALNAPQQQVGSDNLFLLKEGIEFGSMWGRSFVYDLATMSAQLPDGGSISDYSVNADGLVVETANIGSVDEAAIAKVDENGVAVFEQIGNQNADFRVGMTSNFTYKNIDFYMLWDWKSGGDIYNRNTQWNTISSRAGIVDQAGKPQNEKKTQNYYGSLYDVNRANKFWVEDGSFVKLREVAISYNFSKEMLARTKVIKNAKLSLIGRNILTFTDYTGWDPEVTNYSSGTQQYFSVDYGVYPTQTSYSLSLKLNF